MTSSTPPKSHVRPARLRLGRMNNLYKPPLLIRNTQDDYDWDLKRLVAILAHPMGDIGCNHPLQPDVQYLKDNHNLGRAFVKCQHCPTQTSFRYLSDRIGTEERKYRARMLTLLDQLRKVNAEIKGLSPAKKKGSPSKDSMNTLRLRDLEAEKVLIETARDALFKEARAFVQRRNGERDAAPTSRARSVSPEGPADSEGQQAATSGHQLPHGGPEAPGAPSTPRRPRLLESYGSSPRPSLSNSPRLLLNPPTPSISVTGVVHQDTGKKRPCPSAHNQVHAPFDDDLPQCLIPSSGRKSGAKAPQISKRRRITGHEDDIIDLTRDDLHAVTTAARSEAIVDRSRLASPIDLTGDNALSPSNGLGPQHEEENSASSRPASPDGRVEDILTYGFLVEDTHPVEGQYDMSDGSFTKMFTRCGLDLRDPIAVMFSTEKKWRFTHVECLHDVPFRFPHGVGIVWAKWGLRRLLGLEWVTNDDDIESPVWPKRDELMTARESGFWYL